MRGGVSARVSRRAGKGRTGYRFRRGAYGIGGTGDGRIVARVRDRGGRRRGSHWARCRVATTCDGVRLGDARSFVGAWCGAGRRANAGALVDVDPAFFPNVRVVRA